MSESREFDRKIVASGLLPTYVSAGSDYGPSRVSMKRHTVVLALGILASVGVTLAQPTRAVAADKKAAAPAMSATSVRNGMRKLWSEHVMYTRNYIISALAGLPDLQVVTTRLMQNQDDIGNAIKQIYGDDTGNKLTALLREHILIAADIVRAKKANESKIVDAGEKRWHTNADQIAALLSSANPHWKKVTLTEMLYKHLELTTYEVLARVKMDWPADVQAYDAGYAHMLMFADLLSDGIIKQNPRKMVQLSQR